MNRSKDKETSKGFSVQEVFRKFAHQASCVFGSAWAFSGALLIVLIWALMGPAFHYSVTWQLVINTGTTIVTFMMVFLIQNTQNRDARAIHLKLDELLRGVKGARTGFVDLEDLSDKDLTRLQHEFEKLREEHGEELSPAVAAIGEELEEVEEEREERRKAEHEKTPAKHSTGHPKRRK